MKKYGKAPCILKVSITSSQYFALIKKYQEDQIKEMIYIYFDTSCEVNQAQLLANKTRLRVRVKNGKYSLELKIKTRREIKEFKQKISDKELANLFLGNLPDGDIKRTIARVDGSLLNIKCSQTSRAKRSFQGGTLVLDKTTCRGKTHFQIEFRSEKKNHPRVVGVIKKEINLQKRAAIITKLISMWCA